MTIEITAEVLRANAEAELAERGEDYTYPGGICAYVLDASLSAEGEYPAPALSDTAPENMAAGCIVGAALVRAGIPFNTFLRDGVNTGLGSNALLEYLQSADLIRYDDAARVWAAEAQTVQDRFRPWREAIERANREVEAF